MKKREKRKKFTKQQMNREKPLNSVIDEMKQQLKPIQNKA